MELQAQCTDVLLIGKTGNGKSSTGNSILGRKIFKVKADVVSVTKEIQVEYSEIDGRVVKVVDGPGVCDTDLNQKESLDMVIKCMQYAVAANPRGYHAILLVVRFGGRFTFEDQQAILMLKGIFGSDFVAEFVILVVTFVDNFKPFEEYPTIQDWCLSQKGVFQDLVKECHGRVAFFDNRNADNMSEQRQILFNMIDNLSSSGQRYQNEHFLKAEKERERLFVDAAAPVIREETMMEISLIIQQLGRIALEKPEGQIALLDQLKGRSERLRQNVEIQMKGTSVLSDVLTNVNRIIQSIDQQIQTATEAIDVLEKKRQMIEQSERIRPEAEQNRQLHQEQELRQAEMRLEELRQQIFDAENYYRSLNQRILSNKAAIEERYHELGTGQNEVMSHIVRAVTEIATKLIGMFFKRYTR